VIKSSILTLTAVVLAGLLFLLSDDRPVELPPIGSRVFMTVDGDIGPLLWKVEAYEGDRAWI
jgi:hypothetical protein